MASALFFLAYGFIFIQSVSGAGVFQDGFKVVKALMGFPFEATNAILEDLKLNLGLPENKQKQTPTDPQLNGNTPYANYLHQQNIGLHQYHSTQQLPIQQHPHQNFPTVQYPQQQYGTQIYPSLQYPNPQYPNPNYLNVQYPYQQNANQSNLYVSSQNQQYPTQNFQNIQYPNQNPNPNISNPLYPNQYNPNLQNPNPNYPNPEYPNQNNLYMSNHNQQYPTQFYPNIIPYPNPQYQGQNNPNVLHPKHETIKETVNLQELEASSKTAVTSPNLQYPKQHNPNPQYPIQNILQYPNQNHLNPQNPNQYNPIRQYSNQKNPNSNNPNPQFYNENNPHANYPNPNPHPIQSVPTKIPDDPKIEKPVNLQELVASCKATLTSMMKIVNERCARTQCSILKESSNVYSAYIEHFFRSLSSIDEEYDYTIHYLKMAGEMAVYVKEEAELWLDERTAAEVSDKLQRIQNFMTKAVEVETDGNVPDNFSWRQEWESALPLGPLLKIDFDDITF